MFINLSSSKYSHHLAEVPGVLVSEGPVEGEGVTPPTHLYDVHHHVLHQ